MKELEEHKDVFTQDYDAFESSILRLDAIQPDTWTVLNMNEECGRMTNEITTADLIYRNLVERRNTVIDLRRLGLKISLAIKHKHAMKIMKLAKGWIESGANKLVFQLLLDIHAKWVFRFFVVPVRLNIFEIIFPVTEMKCDILLCWMMMFAWYCSAVS
jgi:hypothetical protein